MKVLVTGASGFIGGSFFNTYKNHTDFIELWGTGRKKFDEPKYFSHDLTKPIDWNKEIDTIIHIAAKASPWGSRNEFYNHNVLATRNLLEFGKSKNIKKIIYISSSSVYYNLEDQFNIDENDIIGPSFINHYAETKYLGEKLVEESGIPYVILRPRAVFGPGDTVLFPRILEAAKKFTLPNIIRKDGKSPIGDLIYIDNLVEIIHKSATEDVFGIYNLTNAEPILIKEFLYGILERLSIPLPKFSVSYENAIRMALFAEKAYQIFSFLGEPPITQFGIHVFALSKTFKPDKMISKFGHPKIKVEEGVERFCSWYKNSKNL